MVHTASRAPPGSRSGGRSTMAENSQRSRGSMGVVMWASRQFPFHSWADDRGQRDGDPPSRSGGSPVRHIADRQLGLNRYDPVKSQETEARRGSAADFDVPTSIAASPSWERQIQSRTTSWSPQGDTSVGTGTRERGGRQGMATHWSGDPPARRDVSDFASGRYPALPRERGRVGALRAPLVATIAIFALAFLLPAWPWLSGHVTIPWDAKSQFYPQVQFLATSISHGEWPWWTPNVFAGWPQISDPQSLLFSPLHVLLAVFNSAISLRAFDAVIFAYLFLGGLGIILFFHDRGWHMGGAVVAALAFAFGGAASARLQHIGQVISLAYLP